MRLSLVSSVLAGLCSLVGCTTTEFDVTLTDHPDVLSTGGSDKLFELDVISADASVPVADVQLTYQPIGGTITVLNFVHRVDSDGDGAVGPGDTLVGVEPGLDLLDPGKAGQMFTIQLTEKTGVNRVVVHWEGTWGAQ